LKTPDSDSRMAGPSDPSSLQMSHALAIVARGARLELETVGWSAPHYFLSDDAPRANTPSATANSTAANNGRFSASGAVWASKAAT
jgi:hypothetical protein